MSHAHYNNAQQIFLLGVQQGPCVHIQHATELASFGPWQTVMERKIDLLSMKIHIYIEMTKLSFND